MGFVGKKEWRSLVWRMKAAVKKAARYRVAGKRELKFQYDPSSYALNFDDGGGNGIWNPIKNGGIFDLECSAYGMSSGDSDTIWVYVVWVKSD